MRLSRILIAFLISSILVFGCGDDDNLNGVAYPRIRLLLAPGAQYAEITRVVLSVSGPDMEPVEFDLTIDDDGKTASGTISIPSGRDRVFTVTAYSADGVEATGEQHVDVLEPGAEFLLEIALKPAGSVPSESASLYFIGSLGADSIYKLEAGQVSSFHTISDVPPYITGLAISPDGTLYFTIRGTTHIYELRNDSEVLLYDHAGGDVRDIVFDSQGRLYFSDIVGDTRSDSFIYVLDDSEATVFYDVKVSQVDGQWGGMFAFDNDDNLWLSAGTDGNLYKISGGVPQLMFMSQEINIRAFFFEPSGDIIYASIYGSSGNIIYRLTVPEYIQSEVYVPPDPGSYIYDVAPVIAPLGDSGDGTTPDDGTIPDVETITGDDGAPMVLIPAGEFQMGDAFNEGRDYELPVHTVYVDAFYMDVYEVTNARYHKFMDETGHEAPGYWDDPDFNAPDQPVVGVSWHDATAYAEWAGKRLPTEAEWEKAARGGLIGKRYPWGDEITHDDANYRGTGGKDIWAEQTAPVGSFAPNGYGLYDMAGNVWEWCADWYDGNYYSISPERNPMGPGSGTYRVLRGGSWRSTPDTLRAAFRTNNDPTATDSHLGFRCVSAQD